MAAATAGKPKEPSPGQTSKNSPYTLTPADSLGTPGQASTASGSQRSSADEPRAPATTPDPKRPVSFDFGQGPPRGPRDSMDAGSDLAPGSELPSPMGSRPTSMDYGAAATAPPPSLAGRQHPSGTPCGLPACQQLLWSCSSAFHGQLAVQCVHSAFACSCVLARVR